MYKDMSKGKTKFLPKVKFLPFITLFEVAVALIWLPGDFLCMNKIFLQGKLRVFIIPSPWIHKTLQNLSCSYWYFSFLKLFFSLIISRDLIKQEEAIWRINNWLAANDASTRQHSGYLCLLILRPLGEHPDPLWLHFHLHWALPQHAALSIGLSIW